MGFFTKLYSTLLRGTSVLGFKQRWNVRKATKRLSDAEHLIFDKLPKEIEKDHAVSQAIKDLKKALKDEKLGIKALDKLLFELELQEGNLHQAMANFIRNLGSLNVESEQLKRTLLRSLDLMKSNLELENKFDREEYKDIESDMVAAANDRESLRQVITQRFKNLVKDSRFLERIAARAETKKVVHGIETLDSIGSQLAVLRGSKPEKITTKVEILVEGTVPALHEAIQELHDLKKRAFLWVGKIMYHLFVVEAMGKKYANLHLIPKKTEEEEEITVTSLINMIAQDFRMIAQGYRVQIDRLEKNITALNDLMSKIKRSRKS